MIINILDETGHNIRCRNCTLQVSRYSTNGNLAIQAFCPDGEPWSVMTVNPIETLDDEHVCIKDYSEGAGNLKTLIMAGLISEPERMIPSGFVELPVCRLTEKGLAWVKGMLKTEEHDKPDEDAQ